MSAHSDTGANWDLGLLPADVDSVYVPAAASNQPTLAQTTSVVGVQVGNGATVTIDPFDLVASAHVSAGLDPGSGFLGVGGWLELAGDGTLRGRVPRVRVTGTYTLDGSVVASGRLLVAGGRLRDAGHRYRVAP